jgi:2-polyprenyl-6-methoxyphenol hydroxylase-like FAD-dependent oxidoreductase
MSDRRALVIGGSLGELIAAHLLRSIGWDATVFEPFPTAVSIAVALEPETGLAAGGTKR